jgi:hypothetical protein
LVKWQDYMLGAMQKEKSPRKWESSLKS